MSYVSVVLETLKRLKSLMPPPASDSPVDSLSLAPSPGLSDRALILVGNKVDLVRSRSVDIAGKLCRI